MPKNTHTHPHQKNAPSFYIRDTPTKTTKTNHKRTKPQEENKTTRTKPAEQNQQSKTTQEQQQEQQQQQTREEYSL